MSWPSFAMYLVVACVGLPAAFRNPTAAALVISWLAGEIAWMVTGNNLPLSTYFAADIVVVSIIYAKTIRHCGPKEYPSMRGQLRCLVTDLTICDRWIVAIFLLGMWPAYVLSIHPYYKWFWLWGLAISQFLLAGAETAQSYVAHLRSRVPSEPPGNGLAMAGLRGYG